MFSFSTFLLSKEHHIVLKQPSFELILDGMFNQQLNFESIAESRAVNLTYWGKRSTAEIRYGDQQLMILGLNDEVEYVHVQYGQKVKTISFNIQNNPATYSQSYITKHTGHVTVVTPEVYELANIILTLFDAFHDTNYKMYAKGQYYTDLLDWFTPVKDHEIFKKLNKVDYYSLVENGPAYVFNGDKIEPSPNYEGFRATDTIKSNIVLLEQFAKESRFRAFYKRNLTYYQKLSSTFQAGAKPKAIWQWLESQFPVRYQSYKVIFSPLGPGRNSARMFERDDFRETIMFISAPNRYQETTEPKATEPKEQQEIKFTRSFFTEIDHAYVNPTSDQYVDEINAAFNDLKPWYRGGGYNKPYLIFNEYMTWSLFSLYAMDNYSAQEFQFVKNYIENFMINKRGFYRFKLFNDEMIRLYRNKKDTHKVVELYPSVINWIKDNAEVSDKDMVVSR